MSKLYCAYCHSVFDEEELLTWTDKEDRYSREIEHEACPICKEEGCIENMGKCKICGGEIEPDETYCEECNTECETAFRDAIKRIEKITPKNKKKDVTDIFLDWIEWSQE